MDVDRAASAIHRYSPTLRRIIVLVYTTQVFNSNYQILLLYFLIKWGSRVIFFSACRQELNST